MQLTKLGHRTSHGARQRRVNELSLERANDPLSQIPDTHWFVRRTFVHIWIERALRGATKNFLARAGEGKKPQLLLDTEATEARERDVRPRQTQTRARDERLWE